MMPNCRSKRDNEPHRATSVPSLEQRYGPVSRCVSVARRQRRDSGLWRIDLQVSRRLSPRFLDQPQHYYLPQQSKTDVQYRMPIH